MRLARFLGCAACLMLLTACETASEVLMSEQEEQGQAATGSEQAIDSLPLTAAILPPRRPDDLPLLGVDKPFSEEAMAASVQEIPANVTQAQAAPPPQPKQGFVPLPETSTEIIERANAFFDDLKGLSGRFTQTGSNGRTQQGQLYLLRPGRIRFDFDPPSALNIVADGDKVAISNSRMKTQDLYSISQTPLKFLLRDNVRLERDLKVLSAGLTVRNAVIIVEDRSTLGGTSRITLYFDPQVTTLQRWDIEDTQRTKTTITLSALNRSQRPDPDMFVIPPMRE